MRRLTVLRVVVQAALQPLQSRERGVAAADQ